MPAIDAAWEMSIKRNIKSNVKIPIIVLVFSLVFFYISCGINPLAHDLVSYVNQDVLRITQLEIKAVERYASCTGSNFTSSDELYRTLKEDVIPTYSNFLTLLKNIKPVHKEIAELHAIYIHGAEKIYLGFNEKMFAIGNNDVAHILSANKKIEEGYMETSRWREALFRMYKKYNITQENM